MNWIWGALQAAMQIPTLLGSWQSLQKSSEIFDRWQRETQPQKYRRRGWATGGAQPGPQAVYPGSDAQVSSQVNYPMSTARMAPQVNLTPTWADVGVNDFFQGRVPGAGRRRSQYSLMDHLRPESRDRRDALMSFMGRVGSGMGRGIFGGW